MDKAQAFQILASIFPTLRINEEERQAIVVAYKTVEKELGLKSQKLPAKKVVPKEEDISKAVDTPKRNRKSRRSK